MLPRPPAAPVPTSTKPAAASTARAKTVAIKSTVDRPAPVAPAPNPIKVKAATTTAAKATPEAIPSTIVNNDGLDWKTITARAAHANGQSHDHGLCQTFGESSILGHTGVYNTAKEYNDWAKKQGSSHYNTDTPPPAGVPVFYAGNADTQQGHVAVSAGGGYVYSTDANGDRVGKVRYDQLWGGKGSGKYLGWSDAIQGKRGGSAQYIKYDTSTVGKAPAVPKYSGTSSTPASSGSDTFAPSASDSAALRAPGTRFSLGALFGGLNSSSAPTGMSSSVPTPASSSSQFRPSTSAPTDVSMSSNTDTTAKDTSGKSQEVAPVGRL